MVGPEFGSCSTNSGRCCLLLEGGGGVLRFGVSFADGGGVTVRGGGGGGGLGTDAYVETCGLLAPVYVVCKSHTSCV